MDRGRTDRSRRGDGPIPPGGEEERPQSPVRVLDGGAVALGYKRIRRGLGGAVRGSRFIGWARWLFAPPKDLCALLAGFAVVGAAAVLFSLFLPASEGPPLPWLGALSRIILWLAAFVGAAWVWTPRKPSSGGGGGRGTERR